MLNRLHILILIILILLVIVISSLIFNLFQINEQDSDSSIQSVSKENVNYYAQYMMMDLERLGMETEFKKLKAEGTDVVIVQIYPEYEGSGVFWDSEIAPVREDLLKKAVELGHENGLDVWVWMTSLEMWWRYVDWDNRVLDSNLNDFTGWYKRVSPCVDEHKLYLRDIFNEILVYDIDGILLQDDFYIGEGEDYNEACREKFMIEFMRELDKDDLDNKDYLEWRKNQLYTVLSEVRNTIKSNNPKIKIALNTYPDCGINENHCLIYYSQDVSESLKYVDYVVLMSYHKFEGKDVSWIEDVAKGTIKQSSINRVIVKLQTIDWNDNSKISDKELKNAVDSALNSGVENVAFTKF